jgi:PAS domain S-box-containing protein
MRPGATSKMTQESTGVHELVQQLAESDAVLAALKKAEVEREIPAPLSSLLLSEVQKTLVQSKELLEKMLASMQVGVAYLDQQSNYIWVNPAFARQRRCFPENFIGLNHFLEYPDPEDEERFRQALQSRESIFTHAEARTDPEYPDVIRYYDRSFEPVINEDRVIGLVYTEFDVTDHVRLLQTQSNPADDAEKTPVVEREPAQIHQAGPGTLEELLDVDPAGLAVLVGPDFVFRYANAKFRSMMPASKIDPVGRAFKAVWPEEETLYPILCSVLSEKTAVDLPPQERRLAGGTTRWYRYHIRAAKWEDKPAFLINAWDCTDEHLELLQVESSAADARRRADELQAVIGSMSEAVTIFDGHGQPVQVNPATIQAYGFDPTVTPHRDAIERLNVRRLNGDPVNRSELPSQRALKGEQVYNERLVFTNAQNQDQIIIASANPIYHKDILTGAVTVWTNVTERETLLRQIKTERSRLSTLIANAPVGIIAIDRKGRLLLANSKSTDLWGEAGLEGEKLANQPETQGSSMPFDLTELARPAISGRTQVNQEIVINRPGGERQVLLVNSAPIVNSQQEIEGAVAVFQDITAQKMVQQNLRDAKERFSVALKNSPITVYTTDRELRYTWIYHPQYGDGDLIGRRDDELKGAANVEDMMAFKRSVLESGTGQRGEIAMVIGGATYFYDVTAEPLRNDDGEITGLTVAAVDITDQKRVKDEMARNLARIEVQRRLIQQRELERQQIARDLHDGPLQDLIGINYGLREALEISTRRERAYQVDLIQGALQQLIHELRTFCGELRPPALAPFGLEKAIRSHLDTFLAKYPFIQVVHDLAEDQNHLLEEVRMALYRIYQELMNNIVKHSGAASVSVRFHFNEEHAELEVIDDGRGFLVPTDWVETARRGHLGLVGIVERTEAVGGYIRITSHPGKGTKVLVVVPQNPIEQNDITP